MVDYIGKICPFCKTEIRENDEIVICSECEMPHHKDCWIENQGCTTFGCLGTIKTADITATSVTQRQMNYEEEKNDVASSVIYCTKCGTQNSGGASFCYRCGNKLATIIEQERGNPAYVQSNPLNNNPYAYVRQQNINVTNGYENYQTYQSTGVDEEVIQLVGVKTEYYIPKFRELKAQNKQTSWNWAAFLVTPYWFIYRKMYGYGVTALGVVFVLSLIGSGFLSILSWGGYIAMGILGNSIYMRFIEKKAVQAKMMSEPYKSQYIVQNAGVNKNATILTIIGYAILVGLISA